MKPSKPHESQRGYFASQLYDEMKKNKDIVLITFDLGYGMFDAIRDDMPQQFFNLGAAETGGMAVAVGMALSGKTVVVYSITPFLLRRPYEVIKDYIDRESLPIKLVGSGRDDDYKHDGITHYAFDTKHLLSGLKIFIEYWPTSNEDAKRVTEEALNHNFPVFISLKR